MNAKERILGKLRASLAGTTPVADDYDIDLVTDPWRYAADERIAKHADWAKEVVRKHPELNAENAEAILRDEVGAVGRAVEDIRIETARRLLEQGVSVAQAGRRCGFGTEETLRRAFLRRLGASPQAYRERFAG